MNEIKMMMDEDKEIWIGIQGYEGYEISTKGKVRSYWSRGGSILYGTIRRPFIADVSVCELKQSINGSGYFSCVLYKNNTPHTYAIHRLLALHFIPNIKNKPQVDHIDRNRKNNCLSNLRWVTKEENQRNRSISVNNTSGVSGVYFKKNRNCWVADWRQDKKRHQKEFKTKEDAIEWRHKMEQKYYH